MAVLKLAIVRKSLLFALMLFCCLTLTSCAKNAPLDEPPAPIEDELAVSEPNLDESSLVWRVEPTLEYENDLFRCVGGGIFSHDGEGNYLSIDTETGLLTGEDHEGHGGVQTSFLYDEKKGLYGYYIVGDTEPTFEMWPENDFFENIHWYANRLNAFRRIDSAKVIEPGEGEWSYDFSEAYIDEKVAVAYGTIFVTDFIYDFDNEYGVYNDVLSFIALRLNEKWGVLDKEGNIAVPFVFEDILLIDEETAFAKINGKYGILELAESPATYITTDNVNLREGPGTDSERLMTIPQGTPVEVIDLRDGEWYLVEYEGQQGYMKAEFLAEESPEYITIGWKQYSTSMTELDLFDKSLQNEDIIPLQYMTNLTHLNLGRNQISDLSPLSGLAELVELDLRYNEISNLSPLSECVNLTSVNLSVNQISSLELLSGLTNLTNLNLSYNQVSDLTPLYSLANLTSLSLRGSQIRNCSQLSSLTNLTILDLSYNQVGELTPLSQLTNLTSLDLIDNQISDLTPLSGLINLKWLGLHNNQISDLSPLSSLINLTEIHLYYNQISDLSPLSGLTKLNVLHLSHNHISDLTPLSGLAENCGLSLVDNPIADWSPVEHVPNVSGRQ